MPAVALVALLALPAFAGREPDAHALVGARIIPAPGQVIESGTLVIRDGLIEAIGDDVDAPPDARIWDLEGATLYPGLIESYRTIAWPTPEDDENPAQAGHENSLVTPERHALSHAYDEDTFNKLHQAGFTTAVLAPKPGLFRGQSVLLNLGEGDVGSQVLRSSVAHHAGLETSAGGGYPGSLMGSIALFRQTLYDARWHAAAHGAFERNPRQARPPYNTAWAALEDVAAGDAPIVLESRDPQDALRLARLAEEFSLDATYVGNGKEYQRLQELAATRAPWILPIDFPKAPKVDEDHPERADLEALRHWDQAPDSPARMLDAGLTVAFTSHGLSDTKKLHEHLATAIERGLSPDRALAALTTVPAEMWGIADRAGTLEPGKMANIVVADGDFFTKDVKLRALWIDGKYTELKEIKPPTVDPIGTWDIIIDAGPGGQIPATLIFTGTVENLDGTVRAAEGTLPMIDPVVSGETVDFAIDSTPLGMPGTISFVMSIEGDGCSGTGVAPQGSFTFAGDLVSRPNPEVNP